MSSKNYSDLQGWFLKSHCQVFPQLVNIDRQSSEFSSWSCHLTEEHLTKGLDLNRSWSESATQVRWSWSVLRIFCHLNFWIWMCKWNNWRQNEIRQSIVHRKPPHLVFNPQTRKSKTPYTSNFESNQLTRISARHLLWVSLDVRWLGVL